MKAAVVMARANTWRTERCCTWRRAPAKAEAPSFTCSRGRGHGHGPAYPWFVPRAEDWPRGQTASRFNVDPGASTEGVSLTLRALGAAMGMETALAAFWPTTARVEVVAKVATRAVTEAMMD